MNEQPSQFIFFSMLLLRCPGPGGGGSVFVRYAIQHRSGSDTGNVSVARCFATLKRRRTFTRQLCVRNCSGGYTNRILLVSPLYFRRRQFVYGYSRGVGVGGWLGIPERSR